MPNPKLLTIDQAAKFLSVRPGYVRRLVRERRIRFVKVGKFVRLTQEDLEAFIEAGMVETWAP